MVGASVAAVVGASVAAMVGASVAAEVAAGGCVAGAEVAVAPPQAVNSITPTQSNANTFERDFIFFLLLDYSDFQDSILRQIETPTDPKRLHLLYDYACREECE
jgi:hypothetical protein